MVNKKFIQLLVVGMLLVVSMVFGYSYYRHRQKVEQQKKQQLKQVLVIGHKPKKWLQKYYTHLLTDDYAIYTIGDQEESIALALDDTEHFSLKDATDMEEVMEVLEEANLSKTTWHSILVAHLDLEPCGAVLRDKYNVEEGVQPGALLDLEEEIVHGKPQKKTKSPFGDYEVVNASEPTDECEFNTLWLFVVPIATCVFLFFVTRYR